MKTIFKLTGTMLIFSFIFCLISMIPGNISTKIAGNPADTIPDSLDVTGFFRQINIDADAINKQFRSGTVEIADLNPELKQTANGFEITLGATNIPSPVVYKGKVFVSGGFGSKQYYAFDAQTGKKVWAINLDDDGPSSAAIVDDMIVFNTESCTIFACDINTGKQIWSYWLGDPLMSMPTIANGIVFTAYPSSFANFNQDNQQIQQNNINKINQQKQVEQIIQQNSTPGGISRISHVLIAFELKTGKILWQRRIDGDVMSAPVAEGDELYLSTFTGTLFKFRQKTGEIISARSIRATSAPVIYKDKLFISQRSDMKGEKVSESLVNYNSNKINQQKTYTKREAPYLDKDVQQNSKLKELSVSQDAGNGFVGGAPVSSGWVSANENIGQSNVSSLQSFQGSRALYYQGNNYNTMGNELICTDTRTGKETWKQKIDGDIHSEGGFMGTPPLVAGNRIVLASYNGEIYILDPRNGKQLQKFSVSQNIRYQPVIEDGWIYVTTASGKLVAINTNDKELTGWPMWGANPARTNLIK